MAGQGAKKFPAFSKLSSDDVNNYLADQVIMRFATTTARDAAFGGVGEPTLAEGMTAYIDADNSIYTYDGSNWITMVSASQPPAMQLVKTQTVGTAVPSVLVTGAFSSEFDAYRIIYTGGVLSGATDMQFYFGSAPAANGYSLGQVYMNFVTNTLGGSPVNNSTLWNFSGGGDTNGVFIQMELFNPFNTGIQKYCTYMGLSATNFSVMGTGVFTNTSSFTSFTLDPFGAVTMTGGTIRVYGYRK